MSDHRVDALVYFFARAGGVTNFTAAAMGCVQALDAADSAAGYIRIDLNDEALLARIADAIEVPQMYVDGDDNETWLEWQQRAIRVALKGPRQ